MINIHISNSVNQAESFNCEKIKSDSVSALNDKFSKILNENLSDVGNVQW